MIQNEFMIRQQVGHALMTLLKVVLFMASQFAEMAYWKKAKIVTVVQLILINANQNVVMLPLVNSRMEPIVMRMMVPAVKIAI